MKTQGTIWIINERKVKRIDISKWANEHIEWSNNFLKATQYSFKSIEKKKYIKTVSVVLTIGIVLTFAIA